jgi:hypothetical protein
MEFRLHLSPLDARYGWFVELGFWGGAGGDFEEQQTEGEHLTFEGVDWGIGRR